MRGGVALYFAAAGRCCCGLRVSHPPIQWPQIALNFEQSLVFGKFLNICSCFRSAKSIDLAPATKLFNDCCSPPEVVLLIAARRGVPHVISFGVSYSGTMMFARCQVLYSARVVRPNSRCLETFFFIYLFYALVCLQCDCKRGVTTPTLFLATPRKSHSV